MTGDPVTHRMLLGIAWILFGITLTVAGVGALGLFVSFIGLLIAALTRDVQSRG